MSISSLFKKIIYPDSYDGSIYIETLREKYKIDIGQNCKVWSPNQVYIDKTRPHMLHIGNEVKITRNVTILCHDYSRSVLSNILEYGNVGEADMTWIGDNVFIGVNTTILMGTHIGNNSIVGAGSVVSGKFEDGMVIAGNPAKVVCTIDELYTKRKKREIEAAKLYARSWKEKYNRWPTISEMTNAFSWLYLPRTKEVIESNQSMFQLSGINEKVYIDGFLHSTPVYESFEDFLKDCE